MIIDFLTALLFTILFEGVIMLVITKSFKWLLYNFLCNVLTNTTLNLALTLLYRATGSLTSYYISVAAGELIVLFTEALIYYMLSGIKKSHCFFLSLITNAISFVLGILLF